MIKMSLLLSSLIILLVSSVRAETITVPRVDGSKLSIILERSTDSKRVPILLAIDGSLCTPWHLSPWITWLKKRQAGSIPYAVLVVEKPEPTIPLVKHDGSYNIGPDLQCTDEFKKHYTIDKRAFDHLRAIAHLRAHADWWDGRLFIWGFSDGAHIATRVGVFTPETQGMVLIGLGGGTSMTQELEPMMCGKNKDPTKCQSEYRIQIQEIRMNPTPSKTWLGDANTYAAWASRLDAIHTNLVRDAQFPILLIHGSEDGSISVNSARVLAKDMAAPHGSITYREIDGMGHGLGDGLAPEQTTVLYRDSLEWLLDAARQ